MIVVPGFASAKLTAPRKLQSFAAAVHADAAAVSSVRSTVIEANMNGATAVIGTREAFAAGERSRRRKPRSSRSRLVFRARLGDASVSRGKASAAIAKAPTTISPRANRVIARGRHSPFLVVR